ncbi:MULTISPECIES: diacylglycerol/lipid kinase family protein [unclassified Leifsonia]|uniref:diacylglycerol/lipid kinase family protein n=1 Tax=unclassified Leifsonia TaxID=2663824 RepID=UPI000702001F|nr:MULTISPECIES: YegS/Rv2252/BmrU family lipid kinase [unclassified Leifsonia]KQX07263.1 diacylglycerol kinase [Leifsonia sp. Root1293]KRA11546.1 diacylglycerol kinase [Leifsonia sp. Root60]
MSAASALRITVAINPNASFGRNREIGPRVVEALLRAGHDVAMLREPNFELLRREATHAVEAGTDALVVVGGDGMVSLGANLAAGTGLPLGIVAAGTGNDMARGLGLPVGDTDAAIRTLLDSLDREPRLIDAASVRHGDLTTWYAGVLSAGFDAVVNERANTMTRPRGSSRYILALLRELITLKPVRYTLTIDGTVREVEGMLVSVANNVSLGGGMKVAPDALLDDGLLDVFIVKRLSRLEFIRVFPKVFSGTHNTHPAVEIVRASAIRIETDASIVAYADGERVGPLPIDITVVPGALRILV